jgi:hypothetical protein
MRKIMKNWRGYWLIAVAFIHTVFALIMFADDYKSLYDNGIFNSITSVQGHAAVWFFLFGQVLFIVGLLVRHYELATDKKIPLSISLNLLLLTIIGVVLMPDSGFWLVFPVVISMLLNKPLPPVQTMGK